MALKFPSQCRLIVPWLFLGAIASYITYVLFLNESKTNVQDDEYRLFTTDFLFARLLPPSAEPYKLEQPTKDQDFGTGRACANILGKKKRGKFVEAGGHNGETFSRTLNLERQLNWTGLLIEPVPELFKELKSKNRRIWISDVCIGVKKHPYFATFYKIQFDSMASHLEGFMKHINHTADHSLSFQVPCFPLEMILQAANMADVDCLFLDVEESEFDILKTVDWTRFRPPVVTIEHRKAEVDKLMPPNGYVIYGESHQDTVYVRNDVFRTLKGKPLSEMQRPW